MRQIVNDLYGNKYTGTPGVIPTVIEMSTQTKQNGAILKGLLIGLGLLGITSLPDLVSWIVTIIGALAGG